MRDICGQELDVGDEVVIAVTRYRSGKLTKAVILELEDRPQSNPAWPRIQRIRVLTRPGNRKTGCGADECLRVPKP